MASEIKVNISRSDLKGPGHSAEITNVAKKRCIDDLAVEAIEGCLIAKLRAIFSPLDVLRMPNGNIAKIAYETNKSRQTRENLESKLMMLRF
ncbi:hypothetical protein QQS21_004004, partial [Conoideocrella luteorostrata]